MRHCSSNFPYTYFDSLYTVRINSIVNLSKKKYSFLFSTSFMGICHQKHDFSVFSANVILTPASYSGDGRRVLTVWVFVRVCALTFFLREVQIEVEEKRRGKTSENCLFSVFLLLTGRKTRRENNNNLGKHRIPCSAITYVQWMLGLYSFEKQLIKYKGIGIIIDQRRVLTNISSGFLFLLISTHVPFLAFWSRSVSASS